MAYEILIDGNDYTQYVPQQSVSVNEAVEYRGHQMSLIVRLENPGALGSVTRPKAGNIVRWSDPSKVFEGQIVAVDPARVQVPTDDLPDVWIYSCRAIDYSLLFDKNLVAKSYASQAAEDIVIDIVANYTSGFTTNNVQTGAATVPQQDYDYRSPSDCIQELARMVGWSFYIDHDKDVHFFASETYLAPVVYLDLDTDASIYNVVGPSESIEQERNRLYAKDFKVLNPDRYVENFTANGNQKFFGLAVEPSIDIADVEVFLNGGAQSLLEDFVNSTPGDGLTATGTAFFCQYNWGIRFPDGSTPPSGASIAVRYSSYKPENILIYEDLGAQAEMASREGGDGVHEYMISLPDLRATNSDPIAARAQIELAVYAPVYSKVGFRTLVAGWHAGQALQVVSPIHDFDQIMFVTRVSKKPLSASNESGDTVTEYSVELARKYDVYV